MLKIINEGSRCGTEEQLEEFKKMIENNGLKFPFYLLRVYTFIAGVKEDTREWFTNTYTYNDEEYYGSDKIYLDYGLEYAMERLRYFKKFKQRARAERFANERNEWNGMYDLEVVKIEKIEDLFL